MSARVGLFAVCADSLTEMCLYYAAAGILIMGGGWGVHLFWLLLWAAVCALVFPLFLKKSRTAPALAALTAALILAGFGLFALVSATPLRFGYGFVLAVGAGMAVGLPLHFTLHSPKILSHLTLLDVLIGALLLLLLTKEALGIGGGTVALFVLVLFLDAAAAVGLRMTEGGGAGSGSAFKASMVALASAVVLAILVGLMSLLFSRSGSVTGGLLQGIGAFFAAVGGGIESALERLVALFAREESLEALDPGMALPSLAEAELSGGGTELNVNSTALGIVLCALAAAAAVAVVLLLRRHSFSRASAEELSADTEAGVRRTGGTAGILWQRLRAALAFRRTAFVNRDTPAGLLVLLERQGRRARAPRQTGETLRAFLGRMDPAGGLAELADALDGQYYGGGAQMSRKRCRELRRYIRRILRPWRRGHSLTGGGGA